MKIADRSSDVLAIERLYNDYAWAIDAPGSIDAEGVAGCFTEDGVWRATPSGIVRTGRDEIREGFRTLAFDSPMHHFMTNIRVNVADEGDTAKTTAYVLFFGTISAFVGDPPPRIMTRAHRYTNSCRKVDGRWLFDSLLVAFQYGDAI